MIQYEMRLVAILLDDVGPTNELEFVEKYKRFFDVNVDTGELRSAIYQLSKREVIFEISPENDFFDYASIDHDVHGPLNRDECSVDGLDLYTLGPKALTFISDNKAKISDACRFANFGRASTYLAEISYDSSSWTGLPQSFDMNAVRKEDLAILLKEARDRLRSSDIANSSEAVQASSLIGSALLLAEAPDPPADLIWANVSRASGLMGIAQFLNSIISFFAGTARA